MILIFFEMFYFSPCFVKTSPLHICAPKGMVDVTETLLSKGCSVTVADSRGFTPALACAPNDEVAICLAMILQVCYASQANQESTRKSICSIGKKVTLFCFLPWLPTYNSIIISLCPCFF
jgi:hypothetical protein